jgi:hypothetical protein
MCIFDELTLKQRQENDNYLEQLKELVLCFSKLKSQEARKLMIIMLKEVEERENGVRH